MTTSQAAKIIGCTSRQARHLAKTGKLKAQRIRTADESDFGFNQEGYRWNITMAEVVRYRDTPQKGGFPRGRLRSTN